MADTHDAYIDQQLEDLHQRAGDLIKPCRFASSTRLYGELRRRAKSQQRAWHYVMGTFFQMDQSQYLLEFQQMRERAVELIALLEDEERLRQIQADFPVEQYEHLVYSMSSCAYENLAEATGQLEGYNSEGMHACISDGIQICRRTGKLGCIGCFREYACDVYLAADDPEIAMHQCRLVIDQSSGWSDRGDRRWVASVKAAWLEALHGRYEASVSMLREALEFSNAESVPLKTEARLRILFQLDTVLIASGQDPVMQDDPVFAEMPPAGECPLFEHSRDLNTALLLTQKSDWNAAADILTRWDQRLQRAGGTHLWFETRLRLIAVRRLSGQPKQAAALARQLEQRARQANDWLTLRRLDALLAAATPSMLAIIPETAADDRRVPGGKALDSAGQRTPSPDVASQHDGDDVSANTPPESDEATPLAELVAEFRSRISALMESPDETKQQLLKEDLLSVTPDMATHFDDVASLIHMMPWLVGSAADGESIWQWANSLAAAHRNNGLVLSVLGALGDALRFTANEQMAEKITAERTEQLFKKALELDGNRARNHMRAGDHFLRENNIGEAERCFARAFRLDRSLSDVVERLADLYGRTERPRDALHVLDLSLREGCTDPAIAFNAAMIAFRLDQFDSTLTYLDRFESLGGTNAAWCGYYRAVCRYELGDFEAALTLLDAAEEAAQGTGWHLDAVRSAALARAGRLDEAVLTLQSVLATPFFQVDFLSPMGITSLLERLLRVVSEVIQDQTLQVRIETRLLRSGLMPEWWFQSQRESGKPIEGVRLYRCLVVQPLDETWNHDPDRLDGELNWSAYGVEWGVLARSDEEAEETALSWQARCSELAATLEELLPGTDTYLDVPGAVWQSSRFPINEDDSDDGLSSDDDDDDTDDDFFDDTEEF
jgi:tetratricopeptide (TPR) repeat protein